MKKLIVLFLLLVLCGSAEAYITKQNFVYGTLAEQLDDTETTGEVISITNSGTVMSGCSATTPKRLILYDASCSQPSSCAYKEIIDVSACSETTFTVFTRDLEGTAHSTHDWAIGAKFAENPTRGVFEEIQDSIESSVADYRMNNNLLSTSLGSTYKDENTEVATMAAGQSSPHGMVIAKGMLFVSLKTSPGRVLRYSDLDDLTTYDEVIFTQDGAECTTGVCDQAQDIVYSPERDKLYVLFAEADRCSVVELDPDTLLWDHIINDTDADISQGGLEVTETDLFVCSNAAFYVYKFAFGTWTKTAQDTTPYGPFNSIQYDGTSLYVTSGSAAAPGQVGKVNTANTTFSGGYLGVGEHYDGPSDDFAIVGDYLWLALEGFYDEGVIVIVNKSDFSVSYLDVSTIVGSVESSYATFFDGSHVWIAYTTTPGTLIRINPSTKEIGKITLPTDFTMPNEFAFDGQRLFVTAYKSPMRIARISIPYLTDNYYTGNAATATEASNLEGYDLDVAGFTDGYLCTADTGNTEIDCALQAASTNTASTVVQRDGSGNFSAGTITAALTGSASGNQPLEATLTDIADGTIAEDLVNTANPWADNEVSDTLTSSTCTGNAGTATSLVGGNSTTLLGTIPYQSDVNTTTLLAPNTVAALKVLGQTGDGTNGAIPAWTATDSTGDCGSGLCGAGHEHSEYLTSTSALLFFEGWVDIVADYYASGDGDTTTTTTCVSGSNNFTLDDATGWSENMGIAIATCGAASVELVCPYITISGSDIETWNDTDHTSDCNAGTTQEAAVTVYHDDSKALQSALASGSNVHVPAGVFIISSSATMTGWDTYQILAGDGWSSILKTHTDGFCLLKIDDGEGFGYKQVKDLQFYSTITQTSGCGISLGVSDNHEGQRDRLENIRLYHFYNNLYLTYANTNTISRMLIEHAASANIFIDNTATGYGGNHISDSFVYSSPYGLRISDTDNDDYQMVRFSRNTYHIYVAAGINISFGQIGMDDTCTAQGTVCNNDYPHVLIDGGTNLSFTGGHMGCHGPGVVVDGGTGLSITGMSFCNTFYRAPGHTTPIATNGTNEISISNCTGTGLSGDITGFTPYNEIDPNSHITTTETAVAFAFTNDESAYSYSDFGTGFFSGNYDIDFTINVTSSAAGIVAVVGLANTVGALHSTDDAYGQTVMLFETGGNIRFYAREYDNGTAYSDYYNGATSTTYYCTLRRNEAVGTYGTIYLELYSDANRTALISEETVTLHSTQSFRYLYSVQSYDEDQAGRNMTGTLSNVVINAH